MLESERWRKVQIFRDLAGLDRFCFSLSGREQGKKNIIIEMYRLILRVSWGKK